MPERVEILLDDPLVAVYVRAFEDILKESMAEWRSIGTGFKRCLACARRVDGLGYCLHCGTKA